MRKTLTGFLVLVVMVTVGSDLPVAQRGQPDLARQYTEIVRPFTVKYCVSCHGEKGLAAQFDLRPYTTMAAVVKDHEHWALVLDKLSSGQMPPPASAAQPTAEERQTVVAWVDAMRKAESRRNAGDPGLVLARRLSNAEYNNTIRDLTGRDLKPAREFPVDPANQSGFDNSGESLAMSPSLFTKYLQAAREVANHLVLKPGGIAFADHPMLVETDRDRYCVNQIIDFYKSQNTNYSEYFLAAWRYKHRAALGSPNATLASVAAEDRVSPKYLATIWKTLEQTKEDIGPLATLQNMWRALPAAVRGNQAAAAREGADRMRDYVVQLRKKIAVYLRAYSSEGARRNGAALPDVPEPAVREQPHELQSGGAQGRG